MSDKKSENELDEPRFFVSRRGRNVGVNQVDLKGIDIESDDAVAQPEKVSEKTSKKPTKAQKKTNPRWSRRTRIALAVALLLLVVAPLVVAEVITAQYREGVDSARSQLTHITNTSVLPAQKKSSISADQVRAIANNVDGIVGKMCRGGLLDNMASLYPRANASLTDCRANQARYAALVSSLREIETQARYLEQVDAVLRPVATAVSDEYAVVAVQQENWKQATDKIKALNPPSTIRDAHTELLKHAEAIAETWLMLSNAHGNQDAAAFTEAEKALANEYEAVRTTSTKFSDALMRTQAKISNNYNQLK